jgi:hypothetical protein
LWRHRPLDEEGGMSSSARHGRRLLVAVLTIAGCATTAIALAQETVPIQLSVDAKVTPNKAGSTAHPQGVRIDVRAHIKIPEAYDPPLVDSVDVWFPMGGRYNGARYPTCTENVLARRGTRGCPPGSLMGSGSGKATADTVFTYPKITVVNGGAGKVFFYTVLTNPARVQAPVPGTITRLSGKWSYKLHTTIPRQLQIVAGIPIVLRELNISAGRGDWLATTSCPPDHRWRYHVEVTFTTGQQTVYDNSVSCR